MRPEDPPPLKDPVERAALKAKYWQSLTSGIDSENKALAIDTGYANAMAYLNLLIRYRADLDDSAEQARADVKEADRWVEKALKAQKEKAVRTGQNPQLHIRENLPESGVAADICAMYRPFLAIAVLSCKSP